MSKRSCLVELMPNRLLLDHSFGGYKLSLDLIPIYRKPIETGVSVVQPSDEQFSFSHAKMFSFHNHLHVNYREPNSVYFINKNLTLVEVSLSPLNEIIFNYVYQIPDFDQQKPGRYNITIAFPSANTIVVSDGAGSIHTARISRETKVWGETRSLYKDAVCVLSDACLENKELYVVLLYIEEKDKKKKGEGLFHSVIKSKVFTEGEGNTWVEKSSEELSAGIVDYVALEPGGDCIYVVSDKPPKWVGNEILEDIERVTKYSWMQTKDEITIWLSITEETTTEDLEISIDDVQMEVKVRGKSMICGQFFQRIDKGLTSWTTEKNKLEIQLMKQESLMWKCLLTDDKTGEEILDHALVQDIHERLAHLCSEEQETASQSSFNSQQLEECDAASPDMSLVRLNTKTHQCTHEVSLSSSQWLFKVSCDAAQTPAMCLRHDVDACIWQFRKPETNYNTWPHDHVGTFSAFGYVQASKTQKKFVVSPPNLSYVAVCESTHHIYIYRQPSLLTGLKNRHTGKKVQTISKQQLVNLESKEQILGIHATNNFLYVLLENSVCVLVINAE